MPPMPMNQIAFSVNDIPRSMAWYEGVFGFLYAGNDAFDMPEIADIQGLPVSVSQVHWLVDQQANFQIEVFHWDDPTPKTLPDWRLNDIGYNMVGVYARDFDATLERATATGAPPLTEPVGTPGSRRVCLRDPDGLLVEVMEDDPRSAVRRERPRPEVACALRSVTLSVPDLAAARRFWIDTLELSEASGVSLHSPEHESLWGLEGSSRETLLIGADDMFIEIVQYTDPVGRPWPDDYLKSDIGIINIAIGGADSDAYTETVARTRAAGFHHNFEFLTDDAKAVYVDDDQDFDVEILFMSPAGAAQFGYEPVARQT